MIFGFQYDGVKKIGRIKSMNERKTFWSKCKITDNKGMWFYGVILWIYFTERSKSGIFNPKLTSVINNNNGYSKLIKSNMSVADKNDVLYF